MHPCLTSLLPTKHYICFARPIKHILLVCSIFNASRKRFYYEVTSLKDLISKILPEKLLEFFSYVNVKKSCTILTAVFCLLGCCIYVTLYFCNSLFAIKIDIK